MPQKLDWTRCAADGRTRVQPRRKSWIGPVVQWTEGHGFSHAAKAGLDPLCSGRKSTGSADPLCRKSWIGVALPVVQRTEEHGFLGLLPQKVYNLPMAIPGRLPGAGTFFVTSVTSGRRRLFQGMRSYLAYTAGKATTSWHLLSCPITFIFCLPHKGRRSNGVIGIHQGWLLAPTLFKATSLATRLSSHSRCRRLPNKADLHPSERARMGFAGEISLFLGI